MLWSICMFEILQGVCHRDSESMFLSRLYFLRLILSLSAYGPQSVF